MSSYAISEEIISPFGIELGKELEKKYIDENEKSRYWGICYKTKNPPIKNNNFENYSICTTPISKTVTSILAKKKTINDCYGLYVDLVTIISEKYNLEYEKPSYGNPAQVLRNEFISILVSCYNYEILEVRYELLTKEIQKIINDESVAFEENRISEIDQKGL
jgi:hypothetical protein